MRFRDALLKASKNCEPKDRVKLKLATLRPMVLLALHDEVLLRGVECGAIAPLSADIPGEIDWDSLLAFLQELLPMILEFISQLMSLF
jgi:hypothetical protein